MRRRNEDSLQVSEAKQMAGYTFARAIPLNAENLNERIGAECGGQIEILVEPIL